MQQCSNYEGCLESSASYLKKKKRNWVNLAKPFKLSALLALGHLKQMFVLASPLTRIYIHTPFNPGSSTTIIPNPFPAKILN